jgi:hypothetical protein
MAKPKESNGCLWVFFGNPIAWICWLAVAGMAAEGAGVPIPGVVYQYAWGAFGLWCLWLVIDSWMGGPSDDHWTDRGRP